MMSKIPIFVLVILTTLTFYSQAHSNGQGNTLQKSEYTSIGEIWKDIESYQDQIVTIYGDMPSHLIKVASKL
jgi:hypothetical protein